MLLSNLKIINGRAITKDYEREISFQGLQIVIENEKGSIRKWNYNGQSGETKIFYPYGFIKGSIGKDGEETDCFIGDDKYSPFVYIIHSSNMIGFNIREDKVMFGFNSKESARDAFLAHYNNQKFLGEIVEMSMQLFKESLEWKE